MGRVSDQKGTRSPIYVVPLRLLGVQGMEKGFLTSEEQA